MWPWYSKMIVDNALSKVSCLYSASNLALVSLMIFSKKSVHAHKTRKHVGYCFLIPTISLVDFHNFGIKDRFRHKESSCHSQLKQLI